jgi:hypothetical protein
MLRFLVCTISLALLFVLVERGAAYTHGLLQFRLDHTLAAIVTYDGQQVASATDRFLTANEMEPEKVEVVADAGFLVRRPPLALSEFSSGPWSITTLDGVVFVQLLADGRRARRVCVMFNERASKGSPEDVMSRASEPKAALVLRPPSGDAGVQVYLYYRITREDESPTAGPQST